MDIYDIIPAILDSLDKNICTNLSTLKNRYNTARKNKSFDLYRWVSGKNASQVLDMISCSLGLIDTCENDDVFIASIERAKKKNNAKTLMTVVLKLITDNCDYTSDEWMNTVMDGSTITALSIFILLNKSLENEEFDAVLYACCELIYDFYYGLFRWISLKKDDSYNCASDVFNALVRKNYYKNYITHPLKDFLRIQDCGDIGNLTPGEKNVLNKFTSLQLEKSHRTSLNSDQWFCYCNTYTGNSEIFEEYSDEKIAISNLMFRFFSEGLTYKKYERLIKKDGSTFSSGNILDVLTALIKHNHLMFYTDKTKTDFMRILKCEKLLQKDYENSERLFFANTYYRPTCYQEATEKGWLFEYYNPNREKMLIHTVLNLWKCKALLLVLNKDTEKINSYFSRQSNVMKGISEALGFFDKPKVLSDYLQLLDKDCNSHSVHNAATLFKALLTSDAIVISVSNGKKIHTQELPSKAGSENASLIVEETYNELIRLLSKQRTLSFIYSFVEAKLNPSEASIVYSRLEALAENGLEYSRNKRNKHDVITHVFRALVYLLRDEYEYHKFYERLIENGILKSQN